VFIRVYFVSETAQVELTSGLFQAPATGPNSLRMSGASSDGIRNSSGGAYLGSMMVSSGAKFIPKGSGATANN